MLKNSTLTLYEGEGLDEIYTLSNDRPVLVIFTNSWLGSSQILENYLLKIIPQYKKNIYAFKVYADHYPGLASELAVPGYPYLVLIRNGSVIGSNRGLVSFSQLDKAVEHWYAISEA